MTVPQPGLRPPIVPRHQETTQTTAIWNDYHIRSNAFWDEVYDLTVKQIPCMFEYIGGGNVIRTFHEDRSWCWLGGEETEECDGPYAWGQANWVGGYRYAPDVDGEVFTERLMLEVPEPREAEQVADTLVRAARELATMPMTQTC